jgi:hypothetical protein
MPLLGRPAIQALGIIISNVNSSSVDADLGTQKTESYYRARYPNVFLAKDSSTEGSGTCSRLTDMFSFVKSMQILT